MIDILVIGGGIAGTSAAARCSAHGSVALLEAEAHLAYHSSARSAALFEETYGKPSTVALNRASKDYHKTDRGGVLSPRGLMLVGTADTAEAFNDDVKTMEMEEISIPEGLVMAPLLREIVTRVAYHADAWDIDTDRLIQNFVTTLKSNNGTVQTNAEVTAITKTKFGWQVATPNGTFEAKAIVNAAGSWADQIASLAGIAPLGLTPLRRSVARIKAPIGQNVDTWPMLFGPGEHWYAKPDAGALIVSPADETPTHPHDAWPDDLDLAEGLDRFTQHLDVPLTKPLGSWAGLRTFAPDRQLVLGRAQDDPDFIWCAGQGGYGFQTAPAASQFIADILSGRQSVLDAETKKALSPERL